MKLFILAAILVSFGLNQVNSAPSELLSEVDSFLNIIATRESTETANLNEFVDKILVNVDNLVIKDGLDPSLLPDIYKKITEKLPVGHTDLIFNFTEGSLHELSSLERKGNALLSYDKKSEILQIRVPVAFKDLSFAYDYFVKALIIRHDGKVTGLMTHITMDIVLSFDLKKYTANFDNFEFTNRGFIKVKFEGNIFLTDWILQIVSDAGANAVKDDILNLIQELIQSSIQKVLDNINEKLGKLLNHD